jgi:hypothetical protein
VFIVGGALPVLYICWLGVRHAPTRRQPAAAAEVLFTEIVTVGVPDERH